ncbi:MAG: GerMN domain-containing protein [Clostridiales bacterium]|jgi:spore germination protein GerM|nr:GerMN domain-containing protein [Clostridiales bacterium]
MKRHIFIILIVLCVLLSACGEKAVSDPLESSITVYRLLRSEYQTNGELLLPEKIALDGADPVSQAVSALAETPVSDKLQSPIPKGVEILDAERNDDSVTVYMNSAYLDAEGIDKTILDSCITLTMCSIKGIDYVTICVGSEIVSNKLTPDDILLFNTITSPKKAQMRLYFPKTSGSALGAEYHTISFDEDNSAERCILDILLKGPTSADLKNAFPEGVIVLSVYTQDGVCSVSLSGLPAEDSVPTKKDAELAVYSIVNSLTSLANVKSVQILIDGEQVQSLWGFDISRPLIKNESIIGSAAVK